MSLSVTATDPIAGLGGIAAALADRLTMPMAVEAYRDKVKSMRPADSARMNRGFAIVCGARDPPYSRI